MLIVISPAKTLDFESPAVPEESSLPAFVAESARLARRLRSLPATELGQLMDLSPELASLNHARFAAWRPRHSRRNARQAVLAFRGDVYVGLRAETFSADDFAFAQEHLRILSGLYGVLRPLDLIQPYRLEMGTRLANERGSNLYAFWGARIAEQLAAQLASCGASELVNLASQEYFRAVDRAHLAAPVITPVFKEYRGGKLKIVSFSAKRARGQMAGFAIRHRLERAEELKSFAEDGYRFERSLSTAGEWVFVREQPATPVRSGG